MAKTVSDALVERIIAWGITRTYGYPGDGINGVMGALNRRREDVDFIQVRHEEMAAFMACAHAKFTGGTGVCIATSGPGAIHLLAGLYDAKLDHQSVVAIVGQQARSALGGSYQQEIDLHSLFKDVAGAYVEMVVTAPQLRHVVDRAFRIAASQRTVTAIILPNDVQELAAEEPPHEHGTLHSGAGCSSARMVPHNADLQRAADVLNAGSRVAMLVGAGALGATDAVLEVADKLDAGIAKALLGKAAVPDDHPRVTGSIGMLGTKPSYDLMMKCDTLLIVGSAFPYAEFLPPEGQARAVQIDIDARMLSLRYPADVHLIGDSDETLRALLPLLDGRGRPEWRRSLDENIAEWNELLARRAMNDAEPLNPQRVFAELSPRLPERCIVTCDSGSSAVWYARDVRLRSGMRASLSGGLASMGCAVPYALAAKLADPERPVVALVGDGAMQMNGINELISIAKYRERFIDPRLVVLVLNNGDLNMVTWEQRGTQGDPRFAGSQDVPDFSYAAYAAMLGFGAVTVSSAEEVGPAWDQAFAANRPFLIDARTDPNVPLLPPHVTLAETRALAGALLKGDRSSPQVAKAIFRELYPEHR